ncbi:MAG: glycosyltransferase, partial [Dehalococcoidia bacterium]|nr:glycosyltransferase [Dehalococcoidia bacterium]
DNRWWASRLAAPLEGALTTLLRLQCPDFIVSVHPLCHGAALGALKRMGVNVPVAVLVTDLLDIHAAWQAAGVSLFLAPTEGAARQLVYQGCPSNSVHPVGLPVQSDFGNGNGQKATLRLRLGLDPDKPTILVTGGGEGAGPLERAARTIARTLPHAQMVIVCGRNESLHRRISASGLPARILGFVENMAQWMQACDVVVAKAGAVTVAEAVAARRPLLIISALPGQEKGNLRFVLDSGIGAYTPPGPPLAQALRALEAQDYRPAGWLANMAKVDRPLASDQAASLLIERAAIHA